MTSPLETAVISLREMLTAANTAAILANAEGLSGSELQQVEAIRRKSITLACIVIDSLGVGKADPMIDAAPAPAVSDPA